MTLLFLAVTLLVLTSTAAYNLPTLQSHSPLLAVRSFKEHSSSSPPSSSPNPQNPTHWPARPAAMAVPLLRPPLALHHQQGQVSPLQFNESLKEAVHPHSNRDAQGLPESPDVPIRSEAKGAKEVEEFTEAARQREQGN